MGKREKKREKWIINTANSEGKKLRGRGKKGGKNIGKKKFMKFNHFIFLTSERKKKWKKEV